MDTIFAPICPLGGSIVSVRFSGKNAFDVFSFFSVSCEIYTTKDLFFTKLFYQGKLFDEVVCKIFREPNSFTGENIVEFDLHASKIILSEFLQLVANIPNFRFAERGEFSKRAFLNGKINLIKSEGINAIIRAETKQQMKLANKMFNGELGDIYKMMHEKLLQAMSLVEMSIDFSEEDVPKNVITDVKNIVETLQTTLQKSIGDKKVIDKINNGLAIALIGDVNVGKSSLINKIAKREVAIVSPISGTTRDAISTDVDIDGYKVIFYDTAGLRETNDLIEKEGIKRAKDIADCADICIVMFDFEEAKQLSNEEILLKILNYKKQYNNVVFVFNKCDSEENLNECENLIEQLINHNNTELKRSDFLPLSVLDNYNLDKLFVVLKDKITDLMTLQEEQPLVANERCYVLLQQCLSSLEKIDFDTMPIEIIGEELRIANDCIGKIIGKVYTEDILDSIFSKFCIGK